MKYIWSILIAVLIFAPWVPYEYYGGWVDEKTGAPAIGQLAKQLDAKYFGSKREYHQPGYNKITFHGFTYVKLNNRSYFLAGSQIRVALPQLMAQLLFVAVLLVCCHLAAQQRSKMRQKIQTE